MSHFLYIHGCMSKTPDVWKGGITKTPYSAVRARQKFTWEKFGLDYLYFGRPNDIIWLEQEIKEHFKYCSGKILKGYGTELFQVNICELRQKIAIVIETQGLDVIPVTLKEP